MRMILGILTAMILEFISNSSYAQFGSMVPDASNAVIPNARNNLLYTPIACDGFTATDGAISSADSTFTSASADFLTSDVGKLITVAGAGANQHGDTVAIQAAGSGYVIGDTITLTGGSGTQAILVVNNVSAGLITEVSFRTLGSYSSVPSNPIAQGSTSGVGTGGGFNLTWLRDALVTTISSRTSATEVELTSPASATVTGAIWGYGTNYSTEINAALAIGPVLLPAQPCGVTASISLGDGYNFKGITRGKSKLLWLGANRGGPILTTGDPSGVSGYRNGVVSDITIEGLGSADTCLYLHGIAGWRFESVIGQNCVNIQADLDAASPSGALGVLENDFMSLTLSSGTASTKSSMPLKFGNGNDTNNVGFNRFYDLRILYTNRTGFECGYADNNHFFGTWFYQNSGGSATWAADFKGDAGLASCQGQSFYGFALTPASANGTVIARAGATPSRRSSIYSFNLANGIPSPTIQSGAFLQCHDAIGNKNLCTRYGYDSANCGNPTLTAVTANYVAMGCGGEIIPRYSGKVRITIDGAIGNGTAGDGVISTMYYGTGTTPANGDNIETAGTTRTQCGGFPVLANTPSTTFKVPFSITCTATDLAAGTTYWYDVGIKAVTGGNASIYNVRLSADELP